MAGQQAKDEDIDIITNVGLDTLVYALRFDGARQAIERH